MAASGTGNIERNRLLHDTLGDRGYDGVDIIQSFIQSIQLLADTLDILNGLV
jgi:hypothetical protein